MADVHLSASTWQQPVPATEDTDRAAELEQAADIADPAAVAATCNNCWNARRSYRSQNLRRVTH